MIFSTSRITSLLTILCLLLSPITVAGLMTSNTLQFAANGNSLASGTNTNISTLTLLNSVDKRSFGDIQSVTLDTVPLSRLQQEWENAVASCDNKSYGGISPSRSQCINGATIKYPSGTKYCWGVPCGVKYSNVKLTGIGDKPTVAPTGTFDIGAAVEVESNTNISMNIIQTENPGTVDATYGANTTISVQQSSSDPDLYILSSTVEHSEQATSLLSEANEAGSTIMEMVMTQAGSVNIVGCVPPNPCQSENVEFGLNNAGLPDTLSQEILKFTTSDSQGGILPDYELTVGDEATFSFGSTELENLGLPLDKIEYEITSPSFFATFPVPHSAGLPVGDIGLYNAAFEFTNTDKCYYNDIGITGSKSCLNTSEFDAANGTITRTIAPGSRTSSTSGEFNSLVQDTDYLRLDLDIDYWLNGGVGFGAQAGIPLLLGVAVDLLDIDLATFWGRSQELSFNPNLEVTYQFSEPTWIEIDGVFQQVTELSAPPSAEIKIKQPSPTLVVTPVYSIKNNSFTNTMWNYVDFAIESKMLAATISGGMFELVPPELDISGSYGALQSTLGFGETNLNEYFKETTTLLGFEDIMGQKISFEALFIDNPDPTPQVAEPKMAFLFTMALMLIVTIRKQQTAKPGE